MTARQLTIETAQRVLDGWRIRGDHVAIHVDLLRRLIVLARLPKAPRKARRR